MKAPQFTLIVSQYTSHLPNSFIANGKTTSGQLFIGYGNTTTQALLDALKDLAVIIKLNQ
jgi:hypothetical protein